MACLDEETILGFCGGRITGGARAAVEEHIGTCDECRALLSAVARSSLVMTDRDEADDDGPGAGLPGPLLRQFDPATAETTPVGIAPLGATQSPVQPGDVLGGKFEVERVLGVGGMGIVVAARHTQLGQRVALKFLLPVACEVPGAVARFLREGKAAARITSEHVARVMDTGVLDVGAPYLVMEYLEGCDLGALVERDGRIPVDDAIEYVLQACEAIVEAHELGIVHRDLKPANLFLSHRADGSPLVKVLDFGISKVEGGSRSHLTSVSTLMGSPRYMSPEQMLCAKDVDSRTDVWALGVILYELVCGKPVWAADTMQGLCALIASAPTPSIRDAAPDAPAILDDVIARCLAKAPADRLASVAELALALEPIAPASARTSIDRVLRVARKDRGIGTGPRPALPVASAVQVPAVSTLSASTTTNDPSRRSSGRVGIVLAAGVALLLAGGIAINAARTPPPAPASAGAASGSTGASTGASAVQLAPREAPSSVAVTAPLDTSATRAAAASVVAPAASPVASSPRRLRAPLPASRVPAAAGVAVGASAHANPETRSPDARSPDARSPDARTGAPPAETSRALSDRK